MCFVSVSSGRRMVALCSAYALRCYCFLRNVVDTLFHGKTAWKPRFGEDFKHQVLPFGCEIKYLPRSENEKQKLHAFGDQWLQGIFLGYLQQKGGGFSKQFIIVDWDDHIMLSQLEESCSKSNIVITKKYDQSCTMTNSDSR